MGWTQATQRHPCYLKEPDPPPPSLGSHWQLLRHQGAQAASSSARSWRKLHGAAPITGDSGSQGVMDHSTHGLTTGLAQGQKPTEAAQDPAPRNPLTRATCPPAHSPPCLASSPWCPPHTPNHNCRGSSHFLSLRRPYSQPGVHSASVWKGGKGPPADDPPHAPAPEPASYRDCRGKRRPTEEATTTGQTPAPTLHTTPRAAQARPLPGSRTPLRSSLICKTGTITVPTAEGWMRSSA